MTDHRHAISSDTGPTSPRVRLVQTRATAELLRVRLGDSEGERAAAAALAALTKTSDRALRELDEEVTGDESATFAPLRVAGELLSRIGQEIDGWSLDDAPPERSRRLRLAANLAHAAAELLLAAERDDTP